MQHARRVAHRCRTRRHGFEYHRVRADTRAPSGYEIDVKELGVVGSSHDFPITPKEHGVDYLLDRRHLWIRTERQQSILRVRHEIINAVREYLNSRGFILAGFESVGVFFKYALLWELQRRDR